MLRPRTTLVLCALPLYLSDLPAFPFFALNLDVHVPLTDFFHAYGHGLLINSVITACNVSFIYAVLNNSRHPNF